MDAQREQFWKQALTVFAICVVLYFAGFAGVQYWRARRGPWEVTFQVETNGLPCVEIAQPKLGITGVKLAFAGTNLPSPTDRVMVLFDEPGKAMAVPFGRVKFLDTTFLPGTVTFDLFGHEVELLPRTLIVDKQEREWRAGERIELNGR